MGVKKNKRPWEVSVGEEKKQQSRNVTNRRQRCSDWTVLDGN
jgi:hypothetical protein